MRKILNDNVRYFKDFDEFLQVIKEDYGDRDAVSWFDRKGRLFSRTFHQLADDARILSEYFFRQGIAGENIALIGENCYQWLVVYLAAAVSGGSAVCIDVEQAEEVICQMVEQSAAKAVFIGKSCLGLCKRQIGCREDKQVFLLSGEDESYKDVDGIIAETMSAGEVRSRNSDLRPDQTAAIVFTSGTTGLSKPVMLSHRALLTNACECNVYVDGGSRAFSALPFCHTYGMTCAVLATWARGGTLILNGNLKTVMRDLIASDAFSLLTVPLMVEAIHNQLWLTAKQNGKDRALRHALKLEKLKRTLGIRNVSKALADVRRKCVGQLQVVICGGAHMNKEIAEEFELMGLTMLQGYGITECSPLVAVNGNEACKLGSVGMVLPSCEIKLVDEEIYVRGKNLMNGYYDMPKETTEAMDGEWFKTGDIGTVDKDGFLYITGRKKNLIVFKNGKKISPERLEDVIRQIPIVKDVMVYGAASGISADDVKLTASIFPDEAMTRAMSAYEILEELQAEIDKLNDTLPLYQQIQMINIREEDFEKTAMMKIKRHTV